MQIHNSWCTALSRNPRSFPLWPQLTNKSKQPYYKKSTTKKKKEKRKNKKLREKDKERQGSIKLYRKCDIYLGLGKKFMILQGKIKEAVSYIRQKKKVSDVIYI